MTNARSPVPSPLEGTEGAGPADEALVRVFQAEPGAASGRRAAETLFSRYDRRVYLWCLRLARDHDRALDLAQEALLTALRDLPGFQHRSRFATWLYTVVRRRALRLLQRERRWLIEETDLDAMEGAATDPAEAALREDEEGWLMGTMNDVLEPVEARALLLRCEEGLPVEEITRLLALPGASGARGVLQSARRKLRAALDRRRAAEGGR